MTSTSAQKNSQANHLTANVLRYHLVGLAAVLVLLLTNLTQPLDTFRQLALQTGGKADTLENLAVAAADNGDYSLARELYHLAHSQTESNQKVLGIKTAIEERIFPQLAIERQINELLPLAKKAPSRLLYLKLSLLYWRLDNAEQSQIYLGLAKDIDPNDPSVTLVNKTISY